MEVDHIYEITRCMQGVFWGLTLQLFPSDNGLYAGSVRRRLALVDEQQLQITEEVQSEIPAHLKRVVPLEHLLEFRIFQDHAFRPVDLMIFLELITYLFSMSKTMIL